MMNLVLSGPIDDNLRNAVVGLSRPRRVVHLHSTADRLDGADSSLATRASVMDACNAACVDHAYVDEHLNFSDFKLLAMDMDSTLITIECIDELADVAGKKEQVAAITDAAMRGDISDFAASLRKRAALLAGVPANLLDYVYEHRLKLSPGADDLIAHARERSLYTVLVSGGFTFFTDRLKRRLSIDEAYANTLLYDGDRLSGEVLSPILDGEGKRSVVSSVAHFIRCTPRQTLVIGDGANDIPMMQFAHTSIAYRGKPTVCEAATHVIRYGTLRTVLDYFARDVF